MPSAAAELQKRYQHAAGLQTVKGAAYVLEARGQFPTGPPNAPLAYRMPDAVRVSGVSKSKLYALAAEGKLRLSRVGGRTLVPHAELQRLIEEGCAA